MPRTETLLSWNMGCGLRAKTDATVVERRLKLLAAMVQQVSPTLIALQEAPAESELLVALGTRFSVLRTTGGVAAVHDNRLWSSDSQDIANPRMAVLGLRAVGAGTALWILSIHGPALYVDEYDKRRFVRSIAERLKALRVVDSLRREIVAGDMNLPPFDQTVMRSDGLHASRCLPWSSDRKTGIDRALFNPTWQLLGRHSGASGTFYQSDIAFDGPWCAIDQIMLSPDLADGGHSIDILDSVNGATLRTRGRIGAPDSGIGSDHLPLLATLTVP